MPLSQTSRPHRHMAAHGCRSSRDGWSRSGPGSSGWRWRRDPGELIWWPYLCAKYGLAFLFILTPACLLQYAVTYEIGRYSALTGEASGAGSCDYIRGSGLFCGFSWRSRSCGSARLRRREARPWRNCKLAVAFSTKEAAACFGRWSIMAVFAFALLTQKRTYLLIERTMWIVAAATVFGLLVACFSPELRSYWPAFLKAMVQPTPLPRAWDPADTDRLLTAITFAGLGGFWTLFYSYWILGKGVGVQRTPSGNGQVPMTAAGDLVSKAERGVGFSWPTRALVSSAISRRRS